MKLKETNMTNSLSVRSFYLLLSTHDLIVTIKKGDNLETFTCTNNVPQKYINQKSNVTNNLISAFDTKNLCWRYFNIDCVVSINPSNSTFSLLEE